MTTIANLGIKVSSDGVEKTEKQLDKLATTSTKSEKAIERMVKSIEKQNMILHSGKGAYTDYALTALGASKAEKQLAQNIEASIKIRKESIKANRDAVREENKRVSAISNTILKLRDQVAAAGQSERQLLKYKMTLMGATAAEKKEALALQKTSAEFKKSRESAAKYKQTISEVGGALIGYGSIFGAIGLIKTADTWTMISNRLALVTESTEELIDAETKLFKVAQNTRQSYEQTANLYSKIARSTKSLKLSQEDLLGITETINKSLIISGSTSQAADAALVQLGQAFSAGALRGEELNSVLEQAPRLAEAIAGSMGVEIGALKGLASQGKITSKVLVDALKSQSDSAQKISDEFGKMDITVEGSTQQMKNAMMKLIGEIDRGTGASHNLALGISAIATNLDEITDVAKIAAIASIPVIIMKISEAAIVAAGSMKALNSTLVINPWVAAATVILAAAAAIDHFHTSTNEALASGSVNIMEERVKKLKKELVSLQSIADDPILGGVGYYTEIRATEKAISDLEKSIAELTKTKKDLKNTPGADPAGLKEFQDIEKKYDRALKSEISYLEESLSQYKQYGKARPEIVAEMEAEIAKKRASARSKEESAIKKITKLQEAAYKKEMKPVIDAMKEYKKAEKTRQGNIDKTIQKLKDEIATYKQGEEATAAYVLEQNRASKEEKDLATSLGSTIDMLKSKTTAQDVYADILSKTAENQAELNRATAEGIITKAWEEGVIGSFDEYLASMEQVTNYFDKIEETDADKKLKDIGKELYSLASFDGSKFGNTIADGIDNAITAMNNLLTVYDRNEKAQKKIEEMQKELATGKGSPTERAEAMAEIDKAETAMIKNQITGYRELFGTTSQLFEENTKERKALHGAEMAFAAVEIAMNTTKAVSLGVVAVINAMSAGDPYTAVFRGLAVAATVASTLSQIGGTFSMGGSGSSAPVKATSASGTVLGDSGVASESLKNSQDFLEDMHAEDYTQLKGIHSEVKDLNSNITGLVSSLFRGGVGGFTAADMGINLEFDQGAYADILGDAANDVMQKLIDPLTAGLVGYLGGFVTKGVGAIFGGGSETTVQAQGITSKDALSIGELIGGSIIDTIKFADIKTETEGGWFHSDKTSYETKTEDLGETVDNLFTQIFSSLGKSFVNIAELVGQNVKTVEDFAFDIGKIDLKNLETADEINKALSDAISGISDTAANQLFGELIGQYQEVGEGMLETAIRVASEKVVVLETIDKIGSSFKDVDVPALAIEFSQSLLDVAGGFENFIDITSTYYDKFFTDVEKQADIGEMLTKSLASVDIELPGTRELYRDLVEGIDKTDEVGQKAIVTLLELSGSSDKYYSYLEDADKAMQDIFESIDSGVNNILVSSGKITDDDLFKKRFAEKYGVDPGSDHITEAVDFIVSASKETIIGLADEFGVTVSEMLGDISYEAKSVKAEIEKASQLTTMMSGVDYEIATAGMNSFEKSIYDISRSFEDGVRSAVELGASQEDLIKISSKYKIQINSMLSDITESINSKIAKIGMTAMESSVYDIKQEYESNMEQISAIESAAAIAEAQLDETIKSNGVFETYLLSIENLLIAINSKESFSIDKTLSAIGGTNTISTVVKEGAFEDIIGKIFTDLPDIPEGQKWVKDTQSIMMKDAMGNFDFSFPVSWQEDLAILHGSFEELPQVFKDIVNKAMDEFDVIETKIIEPIKEPADQIPAISNAADAASRLAAKRTEQLWIGFSVTVQSAFDRLDMSEIEKQIDTINKTAASQLYDAATLVGEGSDRYEAIKVYIDAIKNRGIADIEAAEAAKIAQEQDDILKQKRQLEIRIMELEGDKIGALTATRDIELKAIDESLRPLQNRIYLLEDLQSAEEKAATAKNDYLLALIEERDLLEGKVNDAKSNYIDLLQKEVGTLDSNFETAKSNYIDLLQEEADTQSGLVDSIGSAIDSIKDYRKSLYELSSTTEAKRDVLFSKQATLASDVKGGNVESVPELISISGRYLDVAKETSRTSVDYAREVAKTNALMFKVQENLGDQLTEAEIQAKYFKDLIAGVNGTEDEVKDWAVAQKLYNTAKTARDNSTYQATIDILTDTGLTKDLLIAQNEYQTLQSELDNNWYSAEITALEDIKSSIDGLRDVFYAANQEVVSSGGVGSPGFESHVVTPVTAASTGAGVLGDITYDGKYPSWATDSGVQNAYDMANRGSIGLSQLFTTSTGEMTSLKSIMEKSNIPGFANGGFHSGGLRMVGEVGAEIEYRPPSQIMSNSDMMKELSNREVVAELKQLRTEVARANFAIAKNTQESAKTLKKFDYDGMPEARTAIAI